MRGEFEVLEVDTPGDAPGYRVHIARGALARLGELALVEAPAHRYAVISDSQVARLYGARTLESLRNAGAEADLVVFPAGEWNKTRDEWARLSDHLLHEGHGRDSAVVALGGGVTGDLAGFVAATFMRGVRMIQLPTTLLAMLDSAVGGKTGVDTDAGKNLIGAFHHPSLVVIDPDLLATLPRHQRASGLAEAVKTAAILDARLWERIESTVSDLVEGELVALESLVRAVVAHKIEVVSVDPREGDRRAILNFGHTIGHALELLAGYGILHGEAVAAGMRVEARLGESLGITEVGTAARLAALLEACELDRAWEVERSASDICRALASDKKSRAGRLRCVLIQRPGEVALADDGRHTHPFPAEGAEEWLAAALRFDSHE